MRYNKNKKQDIKEKILNTAIKLFLCNGFRSTTVKELTDAAKIAKGTLYLYFKSKENILENIIDKFDKEYLEKAIETVNKCKGSFNDKFRTYHRYSTEYTKNNPQLMMVYNTLVGEIVGSGKKAEKMIRKIDENSRALIKSLLDEGKKEGSIKQNTNTELYAYMIMAIYAGMLLQWYVNKNTINAPEYARMFRDLILNEVLEKDTTQAKINKG